MQSLNRIHVKVIDSSFTDIWHVGVRLVKNRNSLFENNRVVGTDRSVCYSAIDIAGPKPSKHIRFHANTLAECAHGVFLGHFSEDPPHQKISIRNNQIRLTNDGIRLFKTQDSHVMGNRVHFNGIGIVLMDSSVHNHIIRNTVTGNEVWDITHDETSVPNHWISNTCVTTDTADVDCP